MPKITPPDFSDHSNQVIAAWICEQFNALEARVAELEEAAKAPTPAVRAAAEKADADKKTTDAKAEPSKDSKKA